VTPPHPASADDHGIHVTLEPLAGRLERALVRFRVQAAHNLLDEAFGAAPADVVARELVLPLYQRAAAGGDRAVERFAASLFETRLLVQARGWDRIDGPCVALACGPREQRTLPLIALGLGLAARHCRIGYLGGFTPVAALAEQRAQLIVVAIEGDRMTTAESRELRALDPALIGSAAPALARELRVVALPGDLEAAAVRAAGLAQRRSSRTGDAASPGKR
jgi:hypothetical protein